MSRKVEEVRLRPLQFEDLSMVYRIRNHWRHLLHNATWFDKSQIRRWYFQHKPQWLVIEARQPLYIDWLKVGYVRLSRIDPHNGYIWVGCDINPDLLRRGIATKTYDILVNVLMDNGPFDVFRCRILSHNIPSLTFALNYGFHIDHVTPRVSVRDSRWVDDIFLSMWRGEKKGG